MEVGKEGNAGHVLTLFDLYWFHRQILSSSPGLPPPPSPALPQPFLDGEDAEAQSSEPRPASRPPLLLRRHRSLSDEATPLAELRIQVRKLQTILSGKEGPVRDEPRQKGTTAGGGENWTVAAKRRRRGKRRGRRRTVSRSLSQLEFEELKGFMDLGFTFSDAEADPRLLSIVPGLQRLAKRAAGDGEPAVEGSSYTSEEMDESAILRPYLSEVWDAQEEEEEEEAEKPLNNWRIPKAADRMDLRDQLRSWAHAVASTVR